jgi:hypothetical protein
MTNEEREVLVAAAKERLAEKNWQAMNLYIDQMDPFARMVEHGRAAVLAAHDAAVKEVLAALPYERAMLAARESAQAEYEATVKGLGP